MLLVRLGMDLRYMAENETKVATLPTVGEVQRAAKIFLDIAYAGATPPPEVLRRMEPINAADPSQPCRREWFEVSSNTEANPSLRLRLGQKNYPHMKMLLQPSPDFDGYLFFADSHDRHLFTAVESEARALAALRQANAEITREIEKQWEQAGVPTFQSYLRRSMG